MIRLAEESAVVEPRPVGKLAAAPIICWLLPIDPFAAMMFRPGDQASDQGADCADRVPADVAEQT